MSGRASLLRPYFARSAGALAGATGCTAVVAAAELAQPWPLKLVIDKLLEGEGSFTIDSGDALFLGGVAGLVLTIALASAIASYRADILLNRAGERIVHDLRSAVYAHLQRLSLAFHHRSSTGDLVTRVTGDVNAVGVLFSESAAAIAAAGLLLAGMATITLMLDPVLAFATFAVTPVLGLLTFRYTGRVKQLARRQRAEEGRIASAASEALSAMPVVKTFGSESFESTRIQRLSETRRAIGVEAARTQARFSGLIDLVGAVAAALAIVLGVFRVAAGALSPGDVVVFAAYASRTYRPMREIARQTAKASRALARADRIAELLAADQILIERPGAFDGPCASADVALEDVSFAYEPERPALTGLTLTVRAGEHLAVVGESGAGKSTLGALIARLYDPQSGRVSIGGRDVRDCSLAWLREQVGLLHQDTVLFDGTVAENIAYAKIASRDEIEAAARAAGAHAFVSALPAGYDTPLGPRGVGLSGGQRQRIGIARVLLRDPAILVLDEPTSGLDAATEAEVLERLRTLSRGRTTISITHSIAQAQDADRVVVIDGGRLAQQGAPQALLAEPGPFRALARRQWPAAGARSRLRVAPAADPALVGLRSLLDQESAAGVIARALDTPAGDPLSIVEVDYVPGLSAHVRYEIELGQRGNPVEVVASLSCRRKPLPPSAGALADRVAERVPARWPLGFDAETGALVQCLPLDLDLPALAESGDELAERLLAMGVPLGPWRSEPSRLAYRAGRSATLQLDGHILKAYADRAQFLAGARGLEWSSARGLGPARLVAALPELHVTIQPALEGVPVPRASAADVAVRAGSFLRDLHDQPVDGLTPCRPGERFEAAVAACRVVSAAAPQLKGRTDALVLHLQAALPWAEELRAAHGDFNASQLVAREETIMVLDFDHLCAAAPALDIASFAANLVGGRPGDLEAARRVLSGVLNGYGCIPPELDWHFAAAIARRAPSPFRLWKKHWPERCAEIISAAESVLVDGALP